MVALEGACSKNVPATSIFIGELLKLQSSTQICNSKWVLGIYIYKFSKEFVVTPGLGAPLAAKESGGGQRRAELHLRSHSNSQQGLTSQESW